LDNLKRSIDSEIAKEDTSHNAWKEEQKKLKESLNFERGLEPKKSMGIGLTVLDKKIIEETNWSENLDNILQVADIVKLIRNYQNYPILIIKFRPENFAVGQELYIGISPADKTDMVETEEIAIHDAKIDIENYYIREKYKKTLYP
jgi:hypothetical protein